MTTNSIEIVSPAEGSLIIPFAPKLSGTLLSRLIQFGGRIERELAEGGANVDEVLHRLRSELSSVNGRPPRIDRVKLMFVSRVLLDLVSQGWRLDINGPQMSIRAPLTDGAHAAKEFVRSGHLLGRNAQLREKSVSEFIKGMERRRLQANGKGWHSIFSLMRDGRELSEKLKKVSQIREEQDRWSALAETVSPYIQFVEGNAVCEHTGLRLGDIWRYFRYTWVNEYKSVPGRSTMILIRDAAAPNHPVIGIAALGSSVAQHGKRDRWIGWHAKTFVKALIENPTSKAAGWLNESLNNLIDGIYVNDLYRRRIISPGNIQKPTDKSIDRLLKESARAFKKHRKNPQKGAHKGQKGDLQGTQYWEKEALTHLYRGKRCRQLARLMAVRKLFREHHLPDGTQAGLQEALKSPKVQSAIAQLVRMVKAEHVGVDMMDITVCGALAPYNLLLGGKLVCMLLCSPEVTQYYAKKYGSQVSIIASSMKGSPVVREPRLVLLCTTSLYGIGSSQYNRVKVPAEAVGGHEGEWVMYKDLGHSYGFGTYHFSRETIELGDTLIGRRKGGRRVNSIFGEGVNPLMRKLREALDFVGLSSDVLLRHGNQRVTYGICLARNFREVLLGLDKRPSFLIPQSSPRRRTDMIAEYWRRRWLSSRIDKPGILEGVAKHTLAYPITHATHGAVVPIDIDANDVGPLFAL